MEMNGPGGVWVEELVFYTAVVDRWNEEQVRKIKGHNKQQTGETVRQDRQKHKAMGKWQE